MKRTAVAQEISRTPVAPDLCGMLIAFEGGSMTNEEVLTMFAHLVRTGLAWSLQGVYGRSAERLIIGGYLDRHGNILKSLDDED